MNPVNVTLRGKMKLSDLPNLLKNGFKEINIFKMILLKIIILILLLIFYLLDVTEKCERISSTAKSTKSTATKSHLHRESTKEC